MSPIEYIEAGILDGNWYTVCEGYERLTGKSLSVPNECNSEEILAMIRSLVSRPYDEPCRQSSDEKPTKKKRGRPKSSKKKVTKTNETEDSSLELDDSEKTVVQKEIGGVRLITNTPDPEEIKKNKLKAEVANRSKLKINRQVHKTYEVKCNECEQLFQSDRPKGEMGQKCRKCLGDKKGRFSNE